MQQKSLTEIIEEMPYEDIDFYELWKKIEKEKSMVAMVRIEPSYSAIFFPFRYGFSLVSEYRTYRTLTNKTVELFHKMSRLARRLRGW